MNLKQQAAHRALDYLREGMVVGLGTGTTTNYFIEFLGERIRSGGLRDLLGVPTSQACAQLALSQGIPLTTLADHPHLDLAVDGADEVDPSLNLIKGMGLALLREKIIETHARLFLVIVDETKLVPRLGTHSPLPVEIVPFEAAEHVRWLNSLDCRAEMWYEKDGSPTVTDNGNYYVSCQFMDGISDPHPLACKLAMHPGIVEHGLFLDMTVQVVVAGMEGVRILERGK